MRPNFAYSRLYYSFQIFLRCVSYQFQSPIFSGKHPTWYMSSLPHFRMNFKIQKRTCSIINDLSYILTAQNKSVNCDVFHKRLMPNFSPGFVWFSLAMTSENELFDHFAGPSSTNVFIWQVFLLLSLSIESSDLRRNKTAQNCRVPSNNVSLDEPLLFVSQFFTHRLATWPCHHTCLFMQKNFQRVWKRVCNVKFVAAPKYTSK